MISFSLAPSPSPSLRRTILYLKRLVNLKVVIARTKDVRVEEIELKLERVLQAGTRSVRVKKVKLARVEPGLYRTELIEAL